MDKQEKKSLTDKTLSGFFWLLSGTGAQALLQLIVTAILARLLSPEDFGVVAAAMVVIFFTELLYEMGVGPAIVQLREISSCHINTAFTFSVMLGFLLAILFYLINPFIADFFGMPALENVLNFLVWIFPLRTISQISYSLLQREMLFKKIAGLDVISYSIGYGIVGIFLAYMDFGIWSLVWANLFQAFIYSSLLLIVKPHKIRLQLNWSVLKELLSFGTGFTVSQLFNFAARKLDYVLVGRLLNAQSLGLYSRAFALMNAPNNMAGTIMSKVLFVGYSKIQDSKERLSNALDKSYSLLFMVSMPLSGIGVVLAPEIVDILLGPKWTGAVAPFQFLVAFMFCRVGYKVGGTLLKSLGKLYILSITQLIYLILVFLGSFFGAKFGINGVAFGVSIAILINFIILVYSTFYYSDLKFKVFMLEFIRFFTLTVLISIPSYFLANYLRENELNSIYILLLESIFLGGCILLVIRYRHGFLLGEHGNWILTKFDDTKNNFLKKIFKTK